MRKIFCTENRKISNSLHYSSFVIEPLELGQAVTLGNMLRRTLLSDLTGFGVESVRINDIKHEFTPISSIREDVIEILSNIKKIVFKESILIREKVQGYKKFLLPGFISETGPIIITAGMLKIPENSFMILNPEEYICTVTDKAPFFCEMDIKLGTGYSLAEEKENKSIEHSFYIDKPKTLFLDTNFSPVQKVNFKVKLISDSKGNLKESLIIEIFTNAARTPSRSLQEALKILSDLLISLMNNNNFLKNYSDLASV